MMHNLEVAIGEVIMDVENIARTMEDIRDGVPLGAGAIFTLRGPEDTEEIEVVVVEAAGVTLEAFLTATTMLQTTTDRSTMIPAEMISGKLMSEKRYQQSG
jgi:hypothetical protein